MYYHISIVHEYPSGFRVSLNPYPMDAILVQFQFYIVCNALQLPLIKAAANNKEIRNKGYLVHVKDEDIFCLFIVGNSSAEDCDLF